MSADFVIESFEPAAEYLKYVDQRVTYWNGKQLTKETCVEWIEKEILK